jgi:hypothetical protein
MSLNDVDSSFWLPEMSLNDVDGSFRLPEMPLNASKLIDFDQNN